VLAYPKFKLGESQIEALLGDYLPFVESVDLPDIAPPMPHCRDKNDQMFIELASIGKADVLISGDADLLTIAEACTFAIETPANFQQRMQNARGER